MGRVFIVGGGPGDPDLLTLKAARVLREADVVLYDRLVSPAVLERAAKTAELIDVGKGDGQHTMPQEQINELLAEHARKGRLVVRLKGGDPFVFGRGGEEALHLAQRGIAFEIVPGVSSAVAGPAYAGIPVTHRGVSGSVTIVTGHACAGHRATEDWRALAASGTLVFLMGVAARADIARQLISAGRPSDEPVAFVQRASTPEQRTVVSTLAAVSEGTVEVEAPATMVVGQVVRLREHLAWFER
jgi:uroporphyrin-III C-methyltransferase